MAKRGVRLAAAVVSLALLTGLGSADLAYADEAAAPPPASIDVSQRATMASLAWPEVPGAIGYAVDYDSGPTFAAPQRVTTATSTTVLTGLDPQTTYFLRVASLNHAAVTGVWGSSVTFTTSAPEYAVDAPAVRLSAASSTSITAKWNSVGNKEEVRYQAAIGTDRADLTSGKLQKKRSVRFEDLSRETKYFVSVRATDPSGDPITAWSPVVEITTPESMPLTAGTYNILCGNCSKGKASWAARRGALVKTIRGEDLDVLGVQEASIGRIRGGGTQYMDLIKRLGQPYKLTEYRRSVSPDNRIIYNANRLKVISHGVIKLPRGSSKRFMAWAIFEQKSTGKRFFFSNTHLEPKNTRAGWKARSRQAKAIVSAIARLKRGLPVVAVGDYASTKWEKWGNKPYDIMEAAGYQDPLGNAYRSRASAPGAFVEKRINTSFASYNKYQRKARRAAGHVNGSNTDYIFVSEMRVSEYEVVVKVNSSGRFIGTIPSDHNLLRATVHLP